MLAKQLKMLTIESPVTRDTFYRGRGDIRVRNEC